MKESPTLVVMRDLYSAVLTGLSTDLREATLGEATDGEGVAVVLGFIGDALRLGLVIEQPLREWGKNLSPELIAAALLRVATEIHQYKLPPVCVGEDADQFAFIVHRRDSAESIKIAIGWVSILTGVPMIDTTVGVAYERLLEALSAIDFQLCERVSRTQIESLLGPRMEMQKEPRWIAKIEPSVLDSN